MKQDIIAEILERSKQLEKARRLLDKAYTALVLATEALDDLPYTPHVPYDYFKEVINEIYNSEVYNFDEPIK